MKKTKIAKLARDHIIKGFFWAIGVTLGFAFVSAFALLLISPFLKLPVVGDFLADVVHETQISLSERTPKGVDVPGE